MIDYLGRFGSVKSKAIVAKIDVWMVQADSDHVKSSYCWCADCQNGTSYRELYVPDPRGKHTFNAGIIKQKPASKSVTGVEFTQRPQMSRHLYLDEVQSSDNSLQGEVKS